MGQGGAMAIEDAVSIATLLPPGTTPERIPSRLGMYETSRRPRVEYVLHYTRLNARDDNDASSARITREFLKFPTLNPEAKDYSRGTGEGHGILFLTQRS
jgi:salicylate hydroxylase